MDFVAIRNTDEILPLFTLHFMSTHLCSTPMRFNDKNISHLSQSPKEPRIPLLLINKTNLDQNMRANLESVHICILLIFA